MRFVAGVLLCAVLLMCSSPVEPLAMPTADLVAARACVKKHAATLIDVSPASFALTAAGQTKTITARVYNSCSLLAITAGSVVWTNSNPSVVTLTTTGTRKALVTAVAAGTAVLTGTYGAVSDQSVATVTTSTVGELAAQADSFVNSISVQTHLTYSSYDAAWSGIIRPRLLELGVRHIREQMSTSATVINRYQDLAANGIQLTGGCWPNNNNGPYNDASHCISDANAIGTSVIDAFDGWNEVDGGKVTVGLWQDAWVAWETSLYNTYKGNGTWAGRPLYANSLAHANSADLLGNRSTILDFGNMHSYPGGAAMPSSVSNTWIPKWTTIAGTKPLVVTETGYHTCPTCTNGVGVSKLAQGKYQPRILTEYWNRGVKRTNLYEFFDESVSTTDREQNWGLVNHDGSVKPAFTAIKNLIALLSDPGSSFVPGRLDYTLPGALATTHHTLLQNRAGTFYLLLWQELNVYNTTSETDITNADDALTLTLGVPATSLQVYQPRTGAGAIQSGTGTSIALSVPDEVIVVQITP